MSTSEFARHEALHYSIEGDKVRCNLCPHACLISDGKRGICGVREHRSSKLYSLIFGRASSIHPDPIEKKPLFHFLPGSTAISFGSVGCNLSCSHCQNHSISRADPSDSELVTITPDDVVRYAKNTGASSVSWTYNEPIIWHEFTTVASKAAHAHGLKTNYVTNGFIQETPLRELRGLIDAMNIDVKAFKDAFYRNVCGARLEPVLRTCEIAHEMNIHIELTYLVIPKHNDTEEELREFSRWVNDKLSPEVPVHFSAFHPDYRLMDVPRTPTSTLERAYRVAKASGLEYVYLGNVHAADKENTYCPDCGSLMIERDGFFVSMNMSKDGVCSKCGRSLNLIVPL
ncbi:MAG: AmmeMemoRadiSam system radical SAM enzyme [Thermoplasmata archaeon]|nr:AmmeMemoRadiSam system radical SAM enzyme [Thermoplasmata archaeon]